MLALGCLGESNKLTADPNPWVDPSEFKIAYLHAL